MYVHKFMDRQNAIAGNFSKFIHPCHIHGAAIHNTRTGNCEACEAACTDTDPIARARNLRSIIYTGQCPIHGATDHHGQNWKCATCHTAAGRSRTPGGRPFSTSPRAIARRAGERSYPASCETHGATSCYVTSGKCEKCFTANGARRKWLRVPAL